MGRRGPPPKATETRRREGNPSKRPLNDAEPQFDSGAQMPPEVAQHPVARAEWDRRVPELLAKRVLTRQDETEFAEYCLQHAICVDLWERQSEIGYDSAIKKGIYKARQTAVAARARIAARFGFTPADRTQVKIADKPPPTGSGRFLSIVK